MIRLHSAAFLLTCTLCPIFGQGTATLVDAGYAPPAPPQVAPGQIVTLYFRGVRAQVDGKPRAAKATGMPLPTTLAGLSARLWNDGQYIPMPLLSVRQDEECAQAQTGSPDCLLTALRVQIPYELNLVTVAGGSQGQSFPAPAQEFVLDEDGRTSRRFQLRPLLDNAHVVTSCDTRDETLPARVCNRSAYHADGRAVDASAPVRRGDGVVVYAYGLGPTFPSADTGKAAPRDARIPESGRRRVWVNLLDSPVNAVASLPRAYHPQADERTAIPTDFVGLTPGTVGVYQVNVRVPASFRPAIACGPEVRSNALLLVTTFLGTEAVPLCVAE